MARFDGSAKCNDVTELWTCSHDRTKAFRCAGGKVELETCDGAGACEPSGDESDAVCHVAPASEAPPPASPYAPEPAKPSGFLEPKSDAAQPSADTGCSVGPTSSPNGWLGAVGLGGAVALVVRRRPRRDRAHPASQLNRRLQAARRVTPRRAMIRGSYVDGSHPLFRRDRRGVRSRAQ